MLEYGSKPVSGSLKWHQWITDIPFRFRRHNPDMKLCDATSTSVIDRSNTFNTLNTDQIQIR